MSSDSPTLEIRVDSDVELDSARTPQRLLSALRRQLRRHDLQRLLAHDQDQQELFSLLSSDGDLHRMPQALLAQLTDTCRRHGIPYSVKDRRAMVSCPAFRCSTTMPPARRDALRRLMLHDSGVLVAPGLEDRSVLTAELLARRQQRTLIMAAPDDCQRWKAQLDTMLDLPRHEVSVAGKENVPGSRVVIATYRRGAELLERRPGAFGMVVFDAVHSIDPIDLMRPIRLTKARYLLGLAAASTRYDSLHGPLYLVCGGVVAELATPTEPRAQKLAIRRRLTPFTFSYGGRGDYQTLLATLVDDAARNRQIAEDVLFEARQGHPCLVLSERREQLQRLQELLQDDTSAAVITAQVRPTERASVVERFERGELTVLLSTSQIAVEAIRTPRVSRVFITFPFSFGKKLERLAKALLAPSPGKTEGVIFDYDDVSVTPLHNACEKRAKTLARIARQAEDDYRDWAQLELDV